MSLEMLNYPDGEPEMLSGAVYGEAYCAYMEAMAMRDIADLTSACHVLEDTDFPLMERIEEYTDLLHDALLESDPTKFDRIADCIFPDVLRSYVYSGLEVNAPLIAFFTEFSGHNKQWLKNTLKPGPKMYMHLGADLDDFSRTRELRYFGRRGLLQLGLGSIGMKLTVQGLAFKLRPSDRPPVA